MALPFGRFRPPWLATKPSGNSRPDPQEALETLQSALEKTQPPELAEWPKPSFFETASSAPTKTLTLERFAQAVNPAARQQWGEEQDKERLHQALQRIRVIAFVGPSGTGKSTRVIELTRQLQIQYFIDDGLLIQGSRIICGTSAKRAKTRMESVRQAIFLDETRAENMKRALAEHQPDRLMILGTSDAMLTKITTHLGLRPPEEVVRIEEITTQEERRIAKQTRLRAGQHTIPVPSLEIKHEFSGSFLDPIHRIKERFERDRSELDLFARENEKTVVRPTFSTLGAYSISEEAMQSLIRLILREVDGLAEVLDCDLRMARSGISLNLEISLYYGYIAQEVMQALQQLLAEKIEEFTSINVLSVAVKARRVVKHPKTRCAWRGSAEPDRSTL